jgi:hypothetical protein
MTQRYDPVFKFDTDDASYKIMGPTSEMIRHDLLMAFHRDVEGKMRQALIDMGWTPPPDDAERAQRKPEPR